MEERLIREYEKKILQKESEQNFLKKEILQKKEDIQKTEEEIEHRKTAHSVLQEASEKIQQKVHTQIASVVSKCLQTIFPDKNLSFQIQFENKRGKTEAKLVLLNNGQERNPMEDEGGGILDVISFALRVACLSLSKPPLRLILILDEPFKFVSEEYQENVKILLEEISKTLGIQIIMVSHIQNLKTGKVINIGRG